MGSRGERARRDLERAEAAIARRTRSRYAWGSVRTALAWYARMRPAMSSPNSMHPRSSGRNARGQEVQVRVDGGVGGDLDEVLATLTTIGGLLAALERAMPEAHRAVELVHLEGRTQREAAKVVGVTQQTVSKRLGQGESFLLGAMLGAGVVG
jgi:DNA-directed RNA polymerase specialized sigma24 family protein